jgi:sigma-B regulation protein RsbU (phosphoserine phosphatase)
MLFMFYTPPNLTDSLILLVDDDKTNRLLLHEIFTYHGFTNLMEAVDGADAIEKTALHTPDLVVLDVMMPNVNGFEYCAHIRAREEFRHLPILVQTALADTSNKTMVFANGADDYISKPIYPTELIARSKVHLERHRNLKQLELYQARLVRELASAQTMQQFLLPDNAHLESIQSTYAICLDNHFQTCSELGGDFWGVSPLSPTTFSLYCVDFSGHGIDAALNTFRLHTLVNEYTGMPHDAGDYLSLMNKKLCALLPIQQFATMFYGIVNTEKNVLRYSSAGSTAPFLFYQNSCIALESSGLPLGISDDVDYPTIEVPFAVGDALMLYSDCLIETADETGNTWQEADIMHKVATTLKVRSSTETFQDLLAHFGEHHGAAINDDLTLLLLQRHA